MKKQTILLLLFLFVAIISFSQEKKYTIYRITANETITSISKKLGITPYDLLKLNPDAEDGINVDDVLIIPNKKYKKNATNPIIYTTPKVPKTPEVIKKDVEPKKAIVVKDSVVDGYLYHTVKPHETIYSLSKKYKVSKRKVRKINKLKRRNTISIGQVLKFPTELKNTVPIISNQDDVQAYDSTKYFSYTVKPQDTFYSLTRLYNVTKDKLIELNPKLVNGLKVTDQILIPKATIGADTTPPKTYKTHIVLAKEGFFKLKQLYGVTEEELIALNPELKDGLKLGMKIKIPVKVEENLMYEGDIQGKELNMVMMLPFKAETSTTFSSKKSSFLNKVTDFYLGSVMALDALKKKGLSVNVKVFDTKNNAAKVSTILNTENFSKTDVIIGPLVFSRFKEAVDRLKSKNIPMISPISKKDHSQILANNVIQGTATPKQLEVKMLHFIKTRYTNQNVIIIANKEEANLIQIKSDLLKDNTIKDITVLHMKDGYIKRELFKESIQEDKENWVILASDSNAVASVAVDNLGIYTKKVKITLFALKKPKNIDEIKTHFLNRLAFHYPSASFIDESRVEVSKFKQAYKNKYATTPSEYAYKGYDTTYDALMRLANHYELSKAFQAGASNRLNSKFNYKLSQTEGYYNDGIFIIKYDNFQLKEVK